MTCVHHNTYKAHLKPAGLVNVKRRTDGTTIAKKLNEISFLDMYHAVECVENGELFHFHESQDTNCPFGRNIHNVLNAKLEQVQTTLENKLQKITLNHVMHDTQYYI